MCGIAGIFDLTGAHRTAPGDLQRMIATLRHRGPDRVAVEACGDAGLAFARLSISDFENGMQPARARGGSVASVCNGAIVNAPALRRELEASGEVFRSRCDTEVVAGAYAVHGPDAPGRLRGQFALAVADADGRSLLLARDPFGICPLFYTVAKETLLFASEIKGLLAHPAVRREVDLTGVDQVLTFPGPVSPRTLFRGINSLPPGHCLQAAVGGGVRLWSYWDLEFRPATETDGRAEDLWVDEFEALFEDAVRRRTADADVPVGVYLSGGLDSSLVGAGLRAVTRASVRSYSIDIRDGGLSEGKYQRLAAQSLRTEHTEIPFDAADVLRRLRTVIFHTEAPVRETFNAATFALSERVAADGGRLVLAGEGADELFAGYVGYRFDRVRHRGAPPTPDEAVLSERLWGNSRFVYDGPLVPARALNRALFAPHLRASYDDWCSTNASPIDTARLRGFDALQRRSYLDTKLRLGDHLLAGHGDRMALAHGVEVRYPFLDAEIAAFAARLPSDLKLRDLTEKYILRQYGARHLPPPLSKREKFAFTAPGSPALLAQGVPLVDHLLARSTIRRQGVFDADAVERLRARYAQPGFRLNVPFERDLLLFVLTFGLFVEVFDLPPSF